MCAARFMPASLPRASNVAKAGSRPVRTLLYVRDLPVAAELSWCVKVQKTFTFPANWNDHPFDICIVRPCAPAVAETPSAKPNNNSVRRFIRDSLLGSLLPPSYRSCPRGAYATARARYSRVGRFSHQYSSGFSSTVVCELTGESGAHLLESESIGTPRSREAEVSPQEWPPTTACELSPKPRDEPNIRPPRGPEPVEVERAVETGQPRHQLEGSRLGCAINLQPRRIDRRSGRGRVTLRANHDRRRSAHRNSNDKCARQRLHRGEATTASREAEELKGDDAAAHCGA